MFRLRDCPEDDTIFVDFNRISSDMYTVSVGAGAVFILLWWMANAARFINSAYLRQMFFYLRFQSSASSAMILCPSVCYIHDGVILALLCSLLLCCLRCSLLLCNPFLFSSRSLFLLDTRLFSIPVRKRMG